MSWKNNIILLALPVAAAAAAAPAHMNVTILQETWAAIKEVTIDPYDIKMIHRPHSETPGDIVSEGLGYGLLISLYLDDQTAFDDMLTGAERYMWTGKWYDWRIDEHGNRVATGAGCDAEQDTALALLGAQRKVDRGLWTPRTNPVYGERAQDIMDNMWTQKMISPGFNVAPGAAWGGDDFLNVGYCSPASYRVFSQVDRDEGRREQWLRVADQCYNVLRQSPGYALGLVPDWMTPSGEFVAGLGYNTYGDGRYLFKDAIRVFWRIGTDLLWHNEPRAAEFLVNARQFIGNASRANFYQMNGKLIPEEDVWVFDGGRTQRPRREHDHMTVGMWATAIYALNDSSKEQKQGFESEMLRFYENGHWGLHEGDENIRLEEQYFDLLLAWFGASFMIQDDFWSSPLTW